MLACTDTNDNFLKELGRKVFRWRTGSIKGKREMINIYLPDAFIALKKSFEFFFLSFVFPQG